jgi:hypothetical protein
MEIKKNPRQDRDSIASLCDLSTPCDRQWKELCIIKKFSARVASRGKKGSLA